MYTGLVLHSKKRQWDLPFLFIKKLTFLEIDTSNGNGKGQDSNGKGQMSHPFCPLPLLLSIMVTGQDSNGRGQNIINMSVLQKYNSLICQKMSLSIKCRLGHDSTS